MSTTSNHETTSITATEPGTFHVPAQDLARGLERVKRAMMKNETGRNLKGAHLRVRAGRLDITATDRARLHRQSYALAGTPEDMEPGFTIRAEDVPRLQDAATAAARYAHSAVAIITPPEAAYQREKAGGAWSVRFTAGPAPLQLEAEPGTFANVDAVIPRAPFQHVVTLQAKELRAALTAVKNAPVHKRDPIRAAGFHFGGVRGQPAESVAITSPRNEAGVVEVTRPIRLNSCEAERPSFFGVNARLLLDVITSTGATGVVRLSWNQQLAPVLVEHTSNAHGFLAIVMPLRIDPDDAPPPPNPGGGGDGGGEPEPEPEPEPEASKPPRASSKPRVRAQPDGTLAPSPGLAAPSSAYPLRLERYSARAVIITGDTRAYQERIKAAAGPRAHGVYHRKATGWVFSVRWEPALRAGLADLLQPDAARADEVAA